MTKNGHILLGAALASVLLCGSAFSADFQERYAGKPAVSGVNGKLDLGYSYLDIDGTGRINAFNGIGSLSMPVTNAIGLQVDVGGAYLKPDGGGSANSLGAGAHLFWRNPDIGLLGAYGHYINLSGGGSSINDTRLGVEGEWYHDQISVEAFGGADIVRGGGSSQSTASFDLVGAYYFTENFRLHAGVSYEFKETFGKVGGEAMLPFGSNNMALYADAAFSKDVTNISTGLRIYFGESGKSLRARHREDDPKPRLTDLYKISGLFGNTGGGTTPPPPPPPECPSARIMSARTIDPGCRG